MGLKPRISDPIELSMSAGGGGFSRRATVNLKTGRCVARVSSRSGHLQSSTWVIREVELLLPGSALSALVATAAAILNEGDTEHREQFAQQGVSFSARSRTQEATADFHIDVGAGTRYDHAWDLVFRSVDAVLARS